MYNVARVYKYPMHALHQKSSQPGYGEALLQWHRLSQLCYCWPASGSWQAPVRPVPWPVQTPSSPSSTLCCRPSSSAATQPSETAVRYRTERQSLKGCYSQVRVDLHVHERRTLLVRVLPEAALLFLLEKRSCLWALLLGFALSL